MPAETHVAGGVPDVHEVFALIRERLADILEIDATAVTMDSRFADHIDDDALALIEMIESVEEEIGERSVGFRVGDEDLADLATVRDAVEYVMAILSTSGLSTSGGA